MNPYDTFATAVLRETLRITPSVPVFTVEAFEDTVVKSEEKEYKIPSKVGVTILVAQLHRDTKVWGDDVSIVIWLGDGFADDNYDLCTGGFFPSRKNVRWWL